MQDFKKLIVWQKAHRLTVEIYRQTRNFPAEERYSLTAQIRRSSSSVPTNIAEGAGRRGNREFQHFLEIAMGSSAELEYQILLAKDLAYWDQKTYEELEIQLIQVRKMLNVLIERVGSRIESKA